MIALACLALLAVASGAPQRTQVISSSQLPLSYQTLQSPIQTVRSQYVQTLQQPFQTVQTLQQPFQTVQTLQQPYQTVQTIQGLQGLQGLQRLQGLDGQILRSSIVQPQQYAQYQTVPYNTISGLNLQPGQVRISQASRPTQIRTQTLKTVVQQQPIVQTVQSNIAPLTIKQVSPQVRVQQVVPQVQTLQTVVPQVQTVQTVVPQVQRINSLQSAYAQRVNAYNTKYNNQYASQYQGVIPVAPEGVNILRQVQEVQADGTYAFAYETENGIKAQEEGRTVNQGTNGESAVVQGSYSYTAPDGTPITVNYVADENGFRAEGEHIPKPSEEITRAVEYLRSLPPRPEDASGQYTPDANGY